MNPQFQKSNMQKQIQNTQLRICKRRKNRTSPQAYNLMKSIKPSNS